ncbi:arylamine N-acetyltransferase family protein [Luedemannella helvata]|uniref:arylamine N-acetyltransferase family protein n=1 Tax=Luedemannella helvata TaxID=349315 RepID=UPI0031E13A88
MGIDIAAYLRRLGLDDGPVPPPSVDWLTRLHRAHVARVPYENLTIQLGRPHGIHRDAAVGRVLAGSGGYCFHLNGAFARLLGALGFDVRRHLAGVQPATSPAPVGATGNHLALTVHGLPTPAEPAGVWLVDVGLGDGPADPLPLRAGEYAQGPFRYALGESAAAPGGWRFGHDPLGSFIGFDMAGGLAPAGAFVDMHAYLSTSPDSPFVQKVIVQRRRAAGADRLRGCVFERVTADGVRGHDVTDPGEWFAILAEVFGLTLHDTDPDERAALWDRTWRAHTVWRATEVTA